MCVSPVPMMVPKTTAETLKHKINPSLELAAPQAVDVLLYTPGNNRHQAISSLSLSREFHIPEFQLRHQHTATDVHTHDLCFVFATQSNIKRVRHKAAHKVSEPPKT